MRSIDRLWHRATSKIAAVTSSLLCFRHQDHAHFAVSRREFLLCAVADGVYVLPRVCPQGPTSETRTVSVKMVRWWSCRASKSSVC